jgi:hypothetical protein
VSLAEIKEEPRLAEMTLVRQSRLSVQPVTENEWEIICNMAGLKKAAPKSASKPAAAKPAAKTASKPAAAPKAAAKTTASKAAPKAASKTEAKKPAAKKAPAKSAKK